MLVSRRVTAGIWNCWWNKFQEYPNIQGPIFSLELLVFRAVSWWFDDEIYLMVGNMNKKNGSNKGDISIQGAPPTHKKNTDYNNPLKRMGFWYKKAMDSSNIPHSFWHADFRLWYKKHKTCQVRLEKKYLAAFFQYRTSGVTWLTTSPNQHNMLLVTCGMVFKKLHASCHFPALRKQPITES